MSKIYKKNIKKIRAILKEAVRVGDITLLATVKAELAYSIDKHQSNTMFDNIDCDCYEKDLPYE